ncbi:MAG TPA: bacillithiol biosynthesis deacetylase BshB1 [Chitinophagaceae bacterium]
MKLDILAIGAHPDDIELGCSGTIITEIRNGKKVGIVDLTEGELGTRGSVETRYLEAAEAARIMGVLVRENLQMPDGFFENKPSNQMKLIRAIRKYQPEIILANAPEDRHPDHGRAARLILDASFLSGLRKVQTNDDDENAQEAWRPKYVFHYIQDRYLEPNFVVDITDVFDERMKAIGAYTTQFYNENYVEDNAMPRSYISTPVFLESVVARARMMGKRIGVKFGEGFVTEKVIGIRNFDALVQVTT